MARPDAAYVVRDRREAIRLAMAQAEPGDEGAPRRVAADEGRGGVLEGGARGVHQPPSGARSSASCRAPPGSRCERAAAQIRS